MKKAISLVCVLIIILSIPISCMAETTVNIRSYDGPLVERRESRITAVIDSVRFKGAKSKPSEFNEMESSVLYKAAIAATVGLIAGIPGAIIAGVKKKKTHGTVSSNTSTFREEVTESLPNAVTIKNFEEEEDKPNIWVVLTSIVLVVVIALVGVYWGTYSFARRAAAERDFAKANQLLFLPQLTQRHDPQLIEYIAALEKLKGTGTPSRRLEGYKAIKTLAKSNYALAVDELEDAKQYAYAFAVSQYRNKETAIAQSFFISLEGYKRSSDYLTLLSGNYSAVKKLIGFENANDIILDQFAENFLNGTWRTADNKYYFSLTEDNRADYNLPRIDLPHSYYRIDDGIYYLYDQDFPFYVIDSSIRKNVFRFTIVNADTIKIYCYKDEHIYTLYRQQVDGKRSLSTYEELMIQAWLATGQPIPEQYDGYY